jgi:hypothetical protein
MLQVYIRKAMKAGIYVMLFFFKQNTLLVILCSTTHRAVNAFRFAVPFRGKRNETGKKFRCVSLTKQLTVLYSISFVERNG